MCTFFICSMNCARLLTMTKLLNNNSLSNSPFSRCSTHFSAACLFALLVLSIKNISNTRTQIRHVVYLTIKHRFYLQKLSVELWIAKLNEFSISRTQKQPGLLINKACLPSALSKQPDKSLLIKTLRWRTLLSRCLLCLHPLLAENSDRNNRKIRVLRGGESRGKNFSPFRTTRKKEESKHYCDKN